MLIKQGNSGRTLLLMTTLISSFVCSADQSDTVSSWFNPQQYRPLATFTAGPDFVQKGQDQTLTLLPPFQNYYTNTNSQSTVADAGVFVGVEREFSDTFGIQLGISGYVATQTIPVGHVWRFTLPEFDTLVYSYDVNHVRAMVEGKFLTTFGEQERLHPYISWGIGAAFNKAKDYLEEPIVDGAIPTLPFNDKTQTSFTWTVGLGIDYSLNSHVRVGVGYQYADLGSVSLGPTAAATTTQTLNFSHLYANQLRFQFTFLV